MKFHNLSNHPAGDACLEFMTNEYSTTFGGYDYVNESEQELFEDEIQSGFTGYYKLVTVHKYETTEVYTGYVRFLDGFPPVCTKVEEYNHET